MTHIKGRLYHAFGGFRGRISRISRTGGGLIVLIRLIVIATIYTPWFKFRDIDVAALISLSVNNYTT